MLEDALALPLCQDLYKGQTGTVCHVSALLRKSPTADWEKKSVDATPTARNLGLQLGHVTGAWHLGFEGEPMHLITNQTKETTSKPMG